MLGLKSDLQHWTRLTCGSAHWFLFSTVPLSDPNFGDGTSPKTNQNKTTNCHMFRLTFREERPFCVPVKETVSLHQNAGHVMQYQLESKSFLVAVEDTRSFLFHWIDSSIHNQSIILISQSHSWCDLTDNRFQGLNVNSISCISHFTDSSQGLIWCTFDRFITEKLPKQKGEKGKRQTLFLWS